MASKCVHSLRDVADILEKDGWPVATAICKHAADRMERMEDLIVSLQDKIEDLDDDS